MNVSTTEQCVSLFEKAKQAYATDVHFHPLEKETIVSFRIEGMMREHQRMKKQTAERIVAHLKFHSGMDIGERRLPQNGAITFHLSDGSLSIRLSTVPLRNGERMAARLLPLSTDIHLSQLPTTTEPVQQLQNLCRLPDGLVIFTGPTGSGKTTSLYAMLQHLVAIDSRHIISVEDPIEKPHDTYTQLQVNEQAGLDYSEALKAALRHDPDVLMVGEIRDEKTAQIAVRAAMTGHLVLTSLHTRHTSGALVRLLEFGVPPNYLAESLVAVIAQRLVYTDTKRDVFVHQRKADYQFLTGDELREELHHFAGEALTASSNPCSVGRVNR